MNRRLGFALLMALVVSVTATALLYGHIKRQLLGKTQTTKILAAARALDAGTPVTAEQLTVIDWPNNVPFEGTISKPEDAIGRILLYPIAAKQPLRDQLLAAPGAAVGLTAKIPDGMRAVAVETNDVNNVSGFLFPGSHVDVLVTLRPQSGVDSVTATVLQDIQILSTGEQLQADPSGKPQQVREV